MIKLIFLFLFPLIASANYDDEFKGYDSTKMLSEARDAFLSYEYVRDKANYIGNRLEKKLVNDFTENFFLISPLITGKLELKASDLNFYVDTRQLKGGVKYVYNF